jgi:hypothetical protein
LRRAHRERCPARAHFAVVCSLSCPSAATSAATARHLQVGAGRRAGARPRRVTTNEASRGRETRPIVVSRHPASTPAGAAAHAPLRQPCWTSKGAPLRAPRRSTPATAPAAAAARRANATVVPVLAQIEAGSTAGRLARAKMHRLPSLTLLCVAWRQASSGAAGGRVRPRPAARAVGGHHHRHGRPRFAPDVAGQLHRRTNGRLSAPSSCLSCPLPAAFLAGRMAATRCRSASEAPAAAARRAPFATHAVVWVEVSLRSARVVCFGLRDALVQEADTQR